MIKELTEELGSKYIAEQFILAHNNMRDNRDTNAFKELNKAVDNSIDTYIQNKIKEN
tara:strand:+ start:25102 stop:25272 length:171 start_codon:yes stop_codon:yes gene_type:complete